MIEGIKNIMSIFFDKEAVTECEEIKSGLINATYRVKVGIKNYILQRLNIDVFTNPELIQNNLDLLDSYLNNHNSNYKLITPLPNKLGEKLIEKIKEIEISDKKIESTKKATSTKTEQTRIRFLLAPMKFK